MENEKTLSNKELLDVTGGDNFVLKTKFKSGRYHLLYAVEPVDFDPHLCYPEYAVSPRILETYKIK